MGVYTEVDIYATFETKEQAEKNIDNLEVNVTNFIKESVKGGFDFALDECDLDGNMIIIKLSSGRYPNAEWQSEKLFEYLKTKNGLIEFEVSVMCPETIIHWEKDNE